MTALLAIGWKFLKGTFELTLPIPIALLVAGYVWVLMDKQSAIRAAVNKAVTEIVAGAELKAAAQEVENQKLLRALAEDKLAEELRRVNIVQAANKSYADKLATANEEKDALEHEIAEMENLPPPDRCLVGDDLFNRLLQNGK